jgi:hypothetical protein
MVDSRAKGARTETVIRDLFRKHTQLGWERVPGSGALDEKHGLKGDLYVPNYKNTFCVEAKGYADDHLTSAILTSKSPQLLEFWQQTIRQAKQVSKLPLLTFKHDRSKVFVAFSSDYCIPENYHHFYVHRQPHSFYVALLEDWLTFEQPQFVS